MPNTYSEIFRDARRRLSVLYESGEAAALSRLLIEELTGLNYSAGLVREQPFDAKQRREIESALQRLEKGEPVQYVVGHTYFLGHRLRVSPDVLIPRPETEELVQWILEDWRDVPAGSAVDIGTGSGCISIALKGAKQGWNITGIDKSAGAISILTENAAANNVAIEAVQMDFLNEDNWGAFSGYDVIVSNPPYIPQSESATLHQNVRDYEPHMALFVPDSDAYVFYRKLADFALVHLQNGGAMYCETHANGAARVARIWQDAGFQTTVRTDVSGTPRMVKGTVKR